MTITAGIDAGSRTIKIVLFDSEKQTILASRVCDQGVDQYARAQELYQAVLEQAGCEPNDVCGVVATGYGRHSLDFAQQTITEITCHAAGVRYLQPEARTVIDMGGQDSKVLHLDQRGKVRDFMMNDRCAAGTGRFLEIVAQRLEGDLDTVAQEAQGCDSPATISSMCVVFAETEIIGLLASGASKASIMAGVQASVATRVGSMAGRAAQGPIFFTGGVALIPGMLQALSSALKCDINVCPNPRYTGALGAALLAKNNIE